MGSVSALLDSAAEVLTNVIMQFRALSWHHYVAPRWSLARPGYDDHAKVVTFVCAAQCPRVVLRARASQMRGET